MKEEYLAFYHEEKELVAYTIRGTFSGEMEATKELLAHENGIPKESIRVIREYR